MTSRVTSKTPGIACRSRTRSQAKRVSVDTSWLRSTRLSRAAHSSRKSPRTTSPLKFSSAASRSTVRDVR